MEGDLNDVETVLSRLGIVLRDTPDSFRDISDVLDEIAGKWDTYTEVEQSAIAVAAAGTRQRENFLVLMRNYGDVLEYQNVQLESSGLAMNRYAIYLDSVEAKSKKLTATWEGMWSKTVNSSIIKGVYDLGTAFLGLIDNIGGVGNALLIVIPLMLTLNSASIANGLAGLITLFGSLKTAIIGVATASSMSSGGVIAILGLAATLITTGIALYNAYGDSATNAANKLKELNDQIENQKNKLSQLGVETKRIEGLYKEFGKLGAIVNKSTTETEKYAAVQNELKELLPQVGGYYKANGDFIITETKNLNALLVLKREEIALTEKKLKETREEKITFNTQQYVKLLSQIQDQQKKVEAAKTELARLTARGIRAGSKEQTRAGELEGIIKYNQSIVDKAMPAIKESFNSIANEYFNLDKNSQAYIRTYLITLGKFGIDLSKELESFAEKAKDIVQPVKDFFNFDTEFNKLKSKIGGISDLVKKSGSGKFGFSDIDALKNSNPDYLNFIKIENGLIEVNTDKLREKALVEANLLKQQAIKEKVSAKEIELLEQYTKELERSTAISKNFTDNLNRTIEAILKSVGNTGSFGTLITGIYQLNTAFEDGVITTDAYISKMNETLSKTNFKETFKGNEEAANTFFTGLTNNATQTLTYISSQFDSGKTSISEYTDQLSGLGNTFTLLGGMAKSLGADPTTMDGLSNSISNATGKLLEMQQVNEYVQEAWRDKLSGTIEFGTEEYNKYMQQIADVAATSGQVFTDMNNNVLTGSDEIYKYLTGNAANFGLFANQTAGRTGNLIEDVVHGAGKMLTAFADLIDNFKMTIKIAAEPAGIQDFLGNILGKSINFLQLPNINLNIGTDAKGATAGIRAMASNLENFKLNLDANVYSNAEETTKKFTGLKDAIKETASATKDATKAFKEHQDSINDLVDLVVKKIKQEKEAQKDALKAQLNAYKKIIDARKKALEIAKEEDDYRDSKEEKEKNISRIESELAELALDDSEESQAARLVLEEELAAAKNDLTEEQEDRNYDIQQEALDREMQLYEDQITARIAAIDEYLSKPGQIANDAIDLINQKADTLYNDLINWNRVYGSGIDADVINTWNRAYAALDLYRNGLGQIDVQFALMQISARIIVEETEKLSDAASRAANSLRNVNTELERQGAIRQQLNTFGRGWVGSPPGGGGGANDPVYQYHDGLERGIVGGGTSQEQQALLKLGEAVLTPDQMRNIVSNMYKIPGTANVSNNNASGITIDMPIVVQGSLDKSVLPELERMAEEIFGKLNSAIQLRGYKRMANQYSI